MELVAGLAVVPAVPAEVRGGEPAVGRHGVTEHAVAEGGRGFKGHGWSGIGCSGNGWDGCARHRENGCWACPFL